MHDLDPRLADLRQDELIAVVLGDSPDPHRVLGAHPTRIDGRQGVVVRAAHPDAVAIEACLADGTSVAMARLLDAGLFAAFLPDRTLPLRYRLRIRFEGGSVWERGDPYRFLPTLGEVDLHLLNEGTHRRLWEVLGAHPRTIDGEEGTAFAVWAPNARRISLVGDFCRWDGRIFPMRRLGRSGVFELFVPGVRAGALYKFEIKTPYGTLRTKTDPCAFSMEAPPDTASRVFQSGHVWQDREWMDDRPSRDRAREPMAIYEVHLGSWRREPEDSPEMPGYREIAGPLAAHVKSLGFNWIELLPVSEHPYYPSWGYQTSGYYAPTARYGSPDDFRSFVETMHREGIGVILDWVPAHFPKDDWALRRFDGTAVYEHDDPRLGEHPDWGTLIFNYERNEVRNFLIANALYWLREFHVDALRVDAVASMLYLDYSRKEGEWIPNRWGGRENVDAIAFLREMNDTIRREIPGAFTIAEESTSWPFVTRLPSEGGLGFQFKWNMGWMHDTLKYFALDPVCRKDHQDQITFAMVYEYSERFLNPLSHDEVVHGKGSLWNKLPGDDWKKFATLRLLFAYQMTRPGKKLVFMGSELAPWREWSHERSLDWHLLAEPARAAFHECFRAIGALYRAHSCLWRLDHEPEGFRWIDCQDRQNSVLVYERRDGDDVLVVALNMTPVPRPEYRIGVPSLARYTVVLDTDEPRFGGSGFASGQGPIAAEEVAWHGRAQSLVLTLPPLSAVILRAIEPIRKPKAARRATTRRTVTKKR